MGGGTRLAIAIGILFLAMVCFFFAFHPGGVQGVSDPDTMLQWLMGEFQNTAGGNQVSAADIAGTPSITGVNAPTSVTSPNLPPAASA
jgi:hypothetical protein